MNLDWSKLKKTREVSKYFRVAYKNKIRHDSKIEIYLESPYYEDVINYSAVVLIFCMGVNFHINALPIGILNVDASIENLYYITYEIFRCWY